MSSSSHDTRSLPSTTQNYAGWPKGMNNILADHELPADTLRDAVDVDVLDSGKIRRRAGTSRFSATPAHSLWTNGPIALCYSAGALNSLSSDGSLVARVAGVSNRQISYTEAGLDIYWSNGTDYGRLSPALVPAPWGVEAPAMPPARATSGGALLSAGTYQVAVSYVTAAGEESVASRVESIAVAANGRVSLSAIPQAVGADVTAIRVYLSQPNGDVLYRIADLADGTTTYEVVAPPAYGQALRTENMARFLPCDMIEHWRGRIYGAVGNVLWCTEPFQFGVYRPAKNFYLFPSVIRLAVGVKTGMFVACDKTYWLEGSGPENFTQKELLPFGAAKRGYARLRDETVMWFSDRGLVIGSDGGNISSAQAANVVPPTYDTAGIAVREQRSIRQAIAVVSGATGASQLPAAPAAPVRWQEDPRSGLSIGDFMDAVVN